MPAKPIVVVGSLNADLVTRCARIPGPGETLAGRDFQVHPGGKGANQAVAAARLLSAGGQKSAVHLIGRLGQDSFAGQLRASLAAAGVDDSAVLASPGSTGVAVITVAETGENSILVTPGANALLTPADLDARIDLLRAASVVLTQLETPLQTVLHLARICAGAGVPLILDPAPAVPLPAELLHAVSWFTPNETEAAFYVAGLSDQAPAASDADDPVVTARALLASGPASVILKRGARGAYLATGGGLAEAVAPFRVQAIDTTAAGDAFNGGFAAALARGLGPTEAARYASAAAALSTTRIGAQPSMPDGLEVEALLSRSASAPGC